MKRQMGTGKLNNVYHFSDCLNEQDVNYHGIRIGEPLRLPDVEDCRSLCMARGANSFVYHTSVNPLIDGACVCKNSDGGRTIHVGSISGETSCSTTTTIATTTGGLRVPFCRFRLASIYLAMNITKI